MTYSPDLLPLLCCPSNGEPLQEGEGVLHTTSGQNQTYPLINGIPWLLPNPQNSLIDWSVKLNHFYQILNAEISELQNEILSSTGATKKRLETLYHAKQSFMRSVFELLTPIVRHPMARKQAYDSLNDIAPSTQNLLSYEANLYRDWVWGDEENKISCDIVCSHIKKEHCKKVVVLGSGAGRLAYDLSQALSPELLVATDINPLLTLASKHILSGQDLKIVEFPMQPINSDYVALEHLIKGHQASPQFHFVFSDANKPAFKKASFDTVITPWLIDIQPLELSHFLQQLNQYIAIGDQWINFGSLVFHQKRDALCYTIEEVKTIALEQGFEIIQLSQQTIPYLKSPYNAGHRIETVWSWSATKVADVEKIPTVQYLPPWLLDISKPIPKADYFKQFNLQHRIYAQLGAEVDGRTSIRKISNKLAKQQGMNPEEASNLVRNLFIDLFSKNQ